MPDYCAGCGHSRASAWKERRRLAAEKNGTVISAADDASPVTMVKVGGVELALRAPMSVQQMPLGFKGVVFCLNISPQVVTSLRSYALL